MPPSPPSLPLLFPRRYARGDDGGGDSSGSVPADLKLATKWLGSAAEQGDVAAMFNLGCLLLGAGDESGDGERGRAAAAERFRKAAEQGHGGAAANLGLCFANGSGVAQSNSDAVRWLSFAKEKGVPQAQDAIDDILKRAHAEKRGGGSPTSPWLVVVLMGVLAMACARGF